MGSRGTYTVRIKVSEDRPKTAGMRRTPGSSKPGTPSVRLARPPTNGTSSRRPGSRGALSSRGLSRGGERPQTTSWVVTDNGQDPRSTRALNATRFERLLYMVKKRIRDKGLVELLSNSYAVDRPSTQSKGLAGSPVRALRPCYRLHRWWKESEQDEIRGLLHRLDDYLSSVKDVVEILKEHLENSSRVGKDSDPEENAIRLQAAVRAALVRVAFGWQVGDAAGVAGMMTGIPEPTVMGDNAELLVVDEGGDADLNAPSLAEDATDGSAAVKGDGGKDKAWSALGEEVFEKLQSALGDIVASLAYNNIAADSDEGYAAFDADEDGHVSLSDLEVACAELRLTTIDCPWLFAQLGGEEGGHIAMNAWAEALSAIDPADVLEARGVEEGQAPVPAAQIEQDVLDLIAAALSYNGIDAELEGYDCLDLDNDGLLTWDDLSASCTSLGLEASPASIKAVWQLLDATRQGSVSRETWAVYMRTTVVKSILRARGVEAPPEGVVMEPHWERAPSNSSQAKAVTGFSPPMTVEEAVEQVIAVMVSEASGVPLSFPDAAPPSAPAMSQREAAAATATATAAGGSQNTSAVSAWLDIGDGHASNEGAAWATAAPQTPSVVVLPSMVAWMPASPQNKLPMSGAIEEEGSAVVGDMLPSMVAWMPASPKRVITAKAAGADVERDENGQRAMGWVAVGTPAITPAPSEHGSVQKTHLGSGASSVPGSMLPSMVAWMPSPSSSSPSKELNGGEQPAGADGGANILPSMVAWMPSPLSSPSKQHNAGGQETAIANEGGLACASKGSESSHLPLEVPLILPLQGGFTLSYTSCGVGNVTVNA
jgi:Ca2+-binding EF-hand superfamily protein